MEDEERFLGPVHISEIYLQVDMDIGFYQELQKHDESVDKFEDVVSEIEVLTSKYAQKLFDSTFGEGVITID